MLPSSSINYNVIQSSSRRPDASQLVPSVSTLFRTHTLYTTLFSDGNPTISSKEHITSSLVTVFVPQSQINVQASSSISKLPLDPVMTMYTTYTFYTTKQPNEIVSSLSTATQYVTVSPSVQDQLPISPSYSLSDEIRPTSSIQIDEQILKTSAYLPESGINVLSSSFRDEMPMISSSINDASIESPSVLQSSTSKLPAIFDTNVGGKSTTIIDGSTVVFFTDFIFPSSQSEHPETHSATETNHVAKGPAGEINFVVDNSSNDEHPVLPKDPTKDESDLINRPENINKMTTPIKPGQVIDLSDILGSSSIGGSLSDTIKDIVQLIAANTNKQSNKDSKDKSSNNDAPVYLPNPPFYKDTVSSVYIENPVLSSDQIGVHQHQRPQIENIAPSFGLEDSSSSLSTNPLIRSSIQDQFDSTKAIMFDTATEQSVSTKYLTSVESSTRTLTLTTTKVYYTRDSPLTITSVLTTTIKPRTFVTTIIGSRTVSYHLQIR